MDDRLNVPVTCPWCGTHYARFQTNCKNCGGPLPLPPLPPEPRGPVSALDFAQAEFPLQEPPPPPRPISSAYTWKLLLTDGWAIAAFVFLLIGGIFACVGVPLSVIVVTAAVGLPFALSGLAFFGAGAAITYWRYDVQHKIVQVLRAGTAIEGRITGTDMNTSVQVNGRHPWTIHYGFSVDGRDYQGRVSTLTDPGPQHQPGQRAYVLYMPAAPEQNALYPHP
jgi:hypothetical protein